MSSTANNAVNFDRQSEFGSSPSQSVGTQPGDINEQGATAQSEASTVPLRDLMANAGVILGKYTEGQYRIKCPHCEGGTDREESLSVKISGGGKHAVWHCFRGTCAWSGSCGHDPDFIPSSSPSPSSSVSPGASSSAGKVGGGGGNKAGGNSGVLYATAKGKPPVMPSPSFIDLGEKALDFLTGRRISRETLERNGIKQEFTYSPAAKKKVNSIAFPYFREGTIVNIKYRGPEKTFWQVKGAEKVLYGLDDIADEDVVIIVEGEIDKLALEEAGYRNCVSVPDGAPKAVSSEPVPELERDVKYQYLWNCREYLDPVKKFVIATDADEPGQALGEELARRLGRERCWKVVWPKSAADLPGSAYTLEEEQPPFGQSEPNQQGIFRKDANQVLIEDGPSILSALIEAAEPYPIRGLFKFSDFKQEIDAFYNLGRTDEVGVSTGWQALDPLYRVVPGELTVVTGVPNSGKSEWIDALACNLATNHHWTFALCSMENKVREHARKLLEKRVGLPFFDSPYSQTRRMEAWDYEGGMAWLDSHFTLLRCEDDKLPDVDWVLDLARVAVLRYGIQGLVIDPYNELDHQRPKSCTETEYVSQMLTKLKRFAQHYGCHVWFVAHPRSIQAWDGKPPGLYDISGSAHFINKCDNGIVVHRDRDPESETPDVVQVLIRKVRNKSAGTIGDAHLRYDRESGRYFDVVDNFDVGLSEYHTE